LLQPFLPQVLRLSPFLPSSLLPFYFSFMPIRFGRVKGRFERLARTIHLRKTLRKEKSLNGFSLRSNANEYGRDVP
jgi:hypothetical protein